MEREKRIRERVHRAFCAPREQFSTNDEWNDYLEQREDVAFNMVEGIDLEETEARLKKVEQENAHLIAASQAKEVEMKQNVYQGEGTKAEEGTMHEDRTQHGDTMQINDEASPNKEDVRKQNQLALLASGWSMELVRKRAMQQAFDTFVLHVGCK